MYQNPTHLTAPVSTRSAGKGAELNDKIHSDSEVQTPRRAGSLYHGGMKRLLWIGLMLTGFFLATFALAAALGVAEMEALLSWLRDLPERSGGRWLIAGLVLALLAVDLLLPVPSQPIMLAAGATLGAMWGGLVSAVGLQLAVMLGYGVCRVGGRRMFDRLVEPGERDRLDAGLKTYGLLTLAVVRGLPILPEVAACLAGLARVSMWRFFTLFAIVNVPFAFLHAGAGAHSTWVQPWPAILVGLGVPGIAMAVYRWRRALGGHSR